MTAQFDNIYLGLNPTPGKLRLAGSGLGWKSSDEREPVTTVPGPDIRYLHWTRVARNYQLKIGTTKGRFTFDGFLKDDFERLSNYCKQYYNLTPDQKDITVRGWNWGVAEVQSQDLAFLVAGRPAFTMPIDKIVNTSIAKTEVTLEFSNQVQALDLKDEDDPVARKKRMRAMPDEVAEVRLYIPGTAKTMQKKKEQARIKAEGGDVESEDENEEDAGDDDEDPGAAQAFFDTIKEKADIGQITGDAICTIPEVLHLTPRGRFDIDFYSDFLRLRGKTYDYRITFKQIQKLFCLPKPDDIHNQIIVNIDPPIRQGQTRYPFLVMQFVNEESLEVDLNLDEETKQKFEGIKERYDDPAHEVISILLRIFSSKKVITPGSFNSADGHYAVKCNVKANDGQLYFLEKQLLFVSRQPIVISLSEIHSVVFARVGGALPSARTFDLNIRMKGSADHATVFSALSRDEQEPIQTFLKNHKVRVKNEMEEIAAAEIEALGDDDSDDDDAMSVDSDRPRASAAKAAASGDEDEDSEVDEDFQASSDDDGSPSEGSSDEDSDMASEFDEDAEKPAKKKQKTS